MSDSQVIARRFRPKTFGQVVGQEAITRTLENAIKSGRIHHAYLFTGARGVGKTTTARILAKALNCAHGPTIEPCGKCASCVDIAASASIDVLEIDAASNTGVDNVRDVIINTVAIAPAQGRFKIFIIDEVHMLSTPAFNALLKTLEEPPSHVKFIMATTELHKVPETILSRCQVFEFRTISLKKIVEQLRFIAQDLNVAISDSALLAIARAGQGSMRDAESALDQVISFAGLEVKDEDVSAALGLVDVETLNETARAIAEEDSSRILKIVDEVVSRGYDLRNFCRELMVHLRALLVIKVSGLDYELLQVGQSEGETLARLAGSFSEQDLVRFFSILAKTEQDIRTSTQPRFHLEIGLMKLVHSRRLYLLEEALARIADLEARLSGSGALPAGGGQSGRAVTTREANRPATASSGFRPVQRAQAETVERMERASPPPQARPASPPAPPAKQAQEPARQPEARIKESPIKREAEPPFEEPPPMLDEPYEVEMSLPPVAAANAKPGGTASAAGKIKDGEKIKSALEARKKMLLLMALEEAQAIDIDGSVLRISFPAASARAKAKVESRDSRQAIEEVCRELYGRPITVSVSLGAAAQAQEAAKEKKAPTAKEQAQNHPAVRALVDKFHGEVLDVIKPES